MISGKQIILILAFLLVATACGAFGGYMRGYQNGYADGFEYGQEHPDSDLMTEWGNFD